MPKPVFVMVTAKTCGHCQNLHKKWGPIRKAIQGLGTVKLTELNLPTMGAKVTDQGYPAGIQKHIGWYPTGLMFDGDVWEQAKAGNVQDMPGLVMDMRTPLTAEGITEWIKNNISKIPKETPSESKSPEVPKSPMFIPTSGSRKVCGEMNIKPRRRYW